MSEDKGFKARELINSITRMRSEFLSRLKTRSSVVEIKYKGKKIICVYLRHTSTTVTVQMAREVFDHLYNGKDLCLSGTLTDAAIKFELNEIEIG